MPETKGDIVKYFVSLVLILGVANAQNIKKEEAAVWFKTGPEKLPRYFQKGAVLPLCGTFEDIVAVEDVPKVGAKTTNLTIGSCLQAKDDISEEPPPLFEILDLKLGLLYIQSTLNTKKKYSIKADGVATVWAKRYPEGDIMLPDYSLCRYMYDWRRQEASGGESPLQTMKDGVKQLPFKTINPGELVRYHIFEYHLGCGT